jgi:hypothetical protein
VSVFERQFFDAGSIVHEAFDPIHLWMGGYFSIIGGVIGALFAFSHYRMIRANMAIMAINRELKRQNEELLKKSGQKQRDPRY